MGTVSRGTRIRALAAVALCALALAGCSSSGGGASDSGGDDAADGSQAVDPGMEPTAAADPGDVTVRQVIVTASATVVVDDPAAAADEIAAMATADGGRVESREEYASSGAGDLGSATLVLRVPSDQLSQMLASLDSLGEVQWITQSEEDVTGTVTDLDARIEALETSTARLQEIMAEAATTEDLLDVEATLSERQADLEALQSQRDALGDQVALSTLTIDLSGEAPAPAEARGGFLGGLETGWNALVSFVGIVLVMIGALLPWALAFGLPLLAILWLWRRYRRSHPKPPRPGGGTGGHAGPYRWTGPEQQQQAPQPQP